MIFVIIEVHVLLGHGGFLLICKRDMDYKYTYGIERASQEKRNDTETIVR
jgi:hypothetical protein